MSLLYQRVFAREYNESTMTSGESGSLVALSVITPSGAVCTNIYCAGAVLERYGSQGEPMHARLADPTGAFELYVDRTNVSAAGILASMDIPCFATVTGEPRAKGSAGPGKCAIRVREIREVDRPVRDAWVLRTADLTLLRIEEIRQVISRERSDERIEALIRHYNLDMKRLRDIAQMVRGAIAGTGGGGQAADAAADPASAVLGIIREHGEKSGITIEEVTRRAARRGMSAAEVAKAVESLLRDDECYQPARGVLKPL